MLSSSVRSYSDVELYSGALPNNKVDLHITRRGEFQAQTTLINLHDVGIQHFSDNLPRTAYANLVRGRAIFSFQTQAGPDLFWGGHQMLPTSILWHNEGSSGFQRSSGAAQWGSLSLSAEKMGGDMSMLAGRDMTSPHDPTTLVPSHAAMGRLQRLHAACCILAKDAPRLLADSQVAASIEQALVDALADCCQVGDGPREGKSDRTTTRVMRQFHAFLEANAERALSMPEISTAIGVSGRTLRRCCSEHLGMGGKQYLTMRRLNLARVALRQGAPDATTVTEVAMRYGFWELGRFSGTYRTLFGESPSQTLRRPQ